MRTFNPGGIVQHFKRELLSEEERSTNKYLYQIIGTAEHTEKGDKAGMTFTATKAYLHWL